MDSLRKQTLDNILLEFLQQHSGSWVHGGDLEKVGQSYGYEGESAKRAMRRLIKSYKDTIVKGFENGCVVYQWVDWEHPSYDAKQILNKQV